jgi:hypothetical protein
MPGPTPLEVWFSYFGFFYSDGCINEASLNREVFFIQQSTSIVSNNWVSSRIENNIIIGEYLMPYLLYLFVEPGQTSKTQTRMVCLLVNQEETNKHVSKQSREL